jgi:hypothetical protein
VIAFFGCLYYAALRPEEAVALRTSDCHLPTSGWGMLRLASEPVKLNETSGCLRGLW